MWSSNAFLLPLHLAITILLIWMGWQDWKTREVSNFLAIPFAWFGMIGLFYRLYLHEPTALFSLLVILLLTAAALRNWMGGADWKALVGLWGLWPLGGLAGLIGGGVWGILALIRTRDRRVLFPGVTAFSVATVLTFLGEMSAILSISIPSLRG